MSSEVTSGITKMGDYELQDLVLLLYVTIMLFLLNYYYYYYFYLYSLK